VPHARALERALGCTWRNNRAARINNSCQADRRAREVCGILAVVYLIFKVSGLQKLDIEKEEKKD